MAPSTFPQFQKLSRELRDKIWNHALPEKDSPALFPWKKGCWGLRHLPKSDPRWKSDKDRNLLYDFRHELLDHVQLDVPLFSVNREARRVAWAWMRKNNIKLRFGKDKKRKDQYSWIFTRPFDPAMDVLYIYMGHMGDFYVEGFETLEDLEEQEQPDLVAAGGVDVDPDITRIAVSALFFHDQFSYLPDMFQLYTSLLGLYVVVDPQPLWRPRWKNHETQQVQGQRFEATGTQGRAYVYNCDNHCYDVHDGNGEFAGDELLETRIMARKHFGAVASGTGNSSFEIRPVFATRR